MDNETKIENKIKLYLNMNKQYQIATSLKKVLLGKRQTMTFSFGHFWLIIIRIRIVIYKAKVVMFE